MGSYVRPTVLVSFTIEELRADAASCAPYQVFTSDRNLKTDIETLDKPLDRLGELHAF